MLNLNLPLVNATVVVQSYYSCTLYLTSFLFNSVLLLSSHNFNFHKPSSVTWVQNETLQHGVYSYGLEIY